jgi:hypothetical protein
VDGGSGDLDLVRPEHDDEAVDGGPADALEHRLQQDALLRRTEACRRSGR